MATRTTKTTQGKRISFKVYNHYYVIGDSQEKALKEVFTGIFDKMPYCVACTKVVYDKGYKDGMLWGRPAMIPYDNGYVGYQNFSFYANKENAVEDYKFKSKLSDDYPDGYYADVILIENPSVIS